MNDSTSPTSPAWPTHWPKDSFSGASAWLLGIFIVLLLLLAFAGGIRGSGALPHAIDPALLDAAIALQFLLEGALVAGVLFALPNIAKFSLRELGLRVPDTRAIAIAVGGAIVMAIVADGGASLIDKFAHVQHQQEAVEIFRALHDRITIALFAAFAVIFAPFAEETIFRMFFFNFGLRYAGFAGGAIVSGVLFGLAHGDFYEALPLALGGVVLCYVYYSTRNAVASMISHGLFNALSIIALLAFPQLTTP